MAEVRDGDQPPHTESDPANTGAPASIFETEAPGTAPSDGTMLVASDSFENIYEPIEAIRPRLGSGIIDSMSGNRSKDDDENEEVLEEEETEEEEKHVVLYDKEDEEKEKDNKLQGDLQLDCQLQGLNNEVKNEKRISKEVEEGEEGEEKEEEEEKEEKLVRMDEKVGEKEEREKVEDEEEEANKPSNDDVVITTSTPSPPPTESLGTNPDSGTNIITHSTDSMSTSTASASTPGGDGSGGPALSAKKVSKKTKQKEINC